MSNYPIVHFDGLRLRVECRTYTNGRPALQLFLEEDDEPYMTASVNIPEMDLLPGEILIKNWSENAGVLEALVQAGVVERLGVRIPTGHVHADLCRLLVGPEIKG